MRTTVRHCLGRLSYSRSYSTQSPKYLPYDPLPLPGTVAPHSSYLILHNPRHPPQSWPEKIQFVSPLLSELQRRAKEWSGLVNMAYPGGEAGLISLHDKMKPWDADRQENYRATLYRTLLPPIRIPSLSLSNLPDLIPLLSTPPQRDPYKLPPRPPNDIHLYICTHGARDCRCGDMGGEVHQALLIELQKRGVLNKRVTLEQVGHVGGHRWAANVLVFPHGDWYGNLRPEDVPSFVSEILSPSYTVDWKHWRGRMGLTQEQQLDLYDAPTGKKKKFSLTFTTYGGQEIPLSVEEGQNLMEVAKEAGLPGIEGVCGGQLECATCHLYISPSPTGIPPPIPSIQDSEEDMLAYAINRKDNSRLGCQVRVTQELVDWVKGGGKIQLPRY